MTRTYDPDLDDVFVNRDGTIRWDGNAIGFVEKNKSELGDWRAEIGDVRNPDAWPGYRASHARTRAAAVADVLDGVTAPD